MNHYQIAMCFPTLRRMIEAEFSGKDVIGPLAHQIDPHNLFLASRNLSAAGRAATDFVLHLYSSDWNFNLKTAIGWWDSEHRAAFYAAMAEEWPSAPVKRDSAAEHVRICGVISALNSAGANINVSQDTIAKAVEALPFVQGQD